MPKIDLFHEFLGQQSAFAGMHMHPDDVAGLLATGITMAYKRIEAAQSRWRSVNAPHLAVLVRAGAKFENGRLVERPEKTVADAARLRNDAAWARSSPDDSGLTGVEAQRG